MQWPNVWLAIGLHCVAASSDFYGMSFGKEAEKSSETIMNLFKLNDTAASGAVCLDGHACWLLLLSCDTPSKPK